MTDDAKNARAEYMRQWRKNNRDRINEYKRKWARENPERVRSYTDKHWAKKAQAM